jgi:hypothetical protein
MGEKKSIGINDLHGHPSQKGFTLFTALISFVLIFLVVLLVQTMISAERSTSDIIGDVEEEQEMQAIADLARADALQAFNLAMRSAIEAHITRDIQGDGIPDNQLLLSPDIFEGAGNDKALILKRIKEKFTADFFGGAPNEACVNACAGDAACIANNCRASGEQFARIAAIYLSTLLQRSDDVGQYDISIQSSTGSPNIEVEVMPVITEAISKTPEFMEIVGCDGTLNGCPTGTFYVNLDLTKISDEEYEKLPQIVVKKRSSEGGVTGRVLKEPLLPKSNLRLYVPLRIFKAIVYSEEIAWRDDGKGIFQPSSTFKKKMSEMRLGICDGGTSDYVCAPRTDVFTIITNSDDDSHVCIGNNRGTLLFTAIIAGLLPPISDSYNTNDQENGATYAMQKLGQTIMQLSVKSNSGPQIDSDLQGTGNGFEILKTETGSEIAPNGSNYIFQPNITIFSPTSRQIEIFGMGQTEEATCSYVSAVAGTVVFRETNDQYIVNSLRENAYGIRFSDSDPLTYAGYNPDNVFRCVSNAGAGSCSPAPPA